MDQLRDSLGALIPSKTFYSGRRQLSLQDGACPPSLPRRDGVVAGSTCDDIALPRIILTRNKTQALPDHFSKTPSLNISSQRSSPFRRPETPGSPSPLRAATPTSSPLKASQPTLRFSSSTSSTPGRTASDSLTPRAAPQQATADDMLGSPRNQRASVASTASHASAVAQGNALSQLQPAQVRQIREGFQILDRDSTGSVNREDVADMLNQLGTDRTSCQRVFNMLTSNGRTTIYLSRCISLLPALRATEHHTRDFPKHHRYEPRLAFPELRTAVCVLSLRQR